jgi:hypothetical protein
VRGAVYIATAGHLTLSTMRGATSINY